MATFEEPNEAFIPSPQRHLHKVRQHGGQIVGRMHDRLEGEGCGLFIMDQSGDILYCYYY